MLYSMGHIPGAVHIDWRADLQDQTMRDYISPDEFAELCARNGITKGTTVIFYGDKSNWRSCYALWAFRLFGHEKVSIPKRVFCVTVTFPEQRAFLGNALRMTMPRSNLRKP